MADLLVDGRLGYRPRLNRRHELCRIHKPARGHLQIEAAIRRAHRVVGRAPIGHQRRLEAPLFAQHLKVEKCILRSVLAVYQVVAVHHGAHMGLLHRSLERRQINLA